MNKNFQNNVKDFIEQLGFFKGIQTNDHVFTLKTIVDKHTKVKSSPTYLHVLLTYERLWHRQTRIQGMQRVQVHPTWI